jgi:hypothetical protein
MCLLFLGMLLLNRYREKEKKALSIQLTGEKNRGIIERKKLLLLQCGLTLLVMQMCASIREAASIVYRKSYNCLLPSFLCFLVFVDRVYGVSKVSFTQRT